MLAHQHVDVGNVGSERFVYASRYRFREVPPDVNRRIAARVETPNRVGVELAIQGAGLFRDRQIDHRFDVDGFLQDRDSHVERKRWPEEPHRNDRHYSQRENECNVQRKADEPRWSFAGGTTQAMRA
ncbi:MAG: hypothetical protein EBR86_10175 [Planctomycetia bacterium]|nr:hypothetical protein [Planctomycetia bacterium]